MKSINAEKMTLRQAYEADVASIVEMLADDELGQSRESLSESAILIYCKAFKAIQQNIHAELWVIELEGKLVATAQVNYLQYLTHQGGKRALIEAVRVHRNYRGEGIGEKLIAHIIERAKIHGCQMAQLTTNKSRTRAKAFYEKLGFVASHEGMKLLLG